MAQTADELRNEILKGEEAPAEQAQQVQASDTVLDEPNEADAPEWMDGMLEDVDANEDLPEETLQQEETPPKEEEEPQVEAQPEEAQADSEGEPQEVVEREPDAGEVAAVPEEVRAPVEQVQPLASESQVQQPQAPQTPQYTPEQIVEARKVALGALEEHFKLSEEDATAIITQPETVVPKMMAQAFLDMHVALQQSMQQSLSQGVPVIVQQSIEQDRESEVKEQAFYDANPDIDRGQHQEAIRGMLWNWLSVNQNRQWTLDDLNTEVGALARVQLRIPSSKPASAPVSKASAPKHKPAPAAPRGGPVRSTNEFERMAEEFDAEDNADY